MKICDCRHLIRDNVNTPITNYISQVFNFSKLLFSPFTVNPASVNRVATSDKRVRWSLNVENISISRPGKRNTITSMERHDLSPYPWVCLTFAECCIAQMALLGIDKADDQLQQKFSHETQDPMTLTKKHLLNQCSHCIFESTEDSLGQWNGISVFLSYTIRLRASKHRQIFSFSFRYVQTFFFV